MNWLEIEHLGRRWRLPAMKAQGRLWFHWQGQTHCVEIESAVKKSTGPGKSGSGSVVAPMPGKIIRVHVKVGDTVQAGQALVVMEAMKMEYTLEAPFVGQVSEIKAVVQDQVVLGTSLVEVRPLTTEDVR